MKVTNRTYCNIYNSYKAIFGCDKGKQQVGNAGKLIIECMKVLNKMTKTVKAIEDEIQNLVVATNEALKAAPDQALVLRNQLQKDMDEFYDNKFQEVHVYKLSMKNFEIFSQFVDQNATITMYNYLTVGSDFEPESFEDEESNGVDKKAGETEKQEASSVQ